ncbi:ABC transporter substrate-binding protein [Gandjariella thermophila]|uniref:ABC transporter substrate-binding protein n=1 Tax=Gandjariella thermophila TaxID=1931992 RepID=UPI001CEF983F|nr:ABC transporter substrate-binding protein [Gandjariella thermophila]
MRPRRLRLLVASLCAFLATAASACTTSSPPATPGGRDTTQITLATAEEPDTLNPLLGYAPSGAAKIFDGLLEHGADGALHPALATEVPQPSADDRSWTVPLRTGVKFSDGTPFGAADVVATYRAVLDPATASPLRPRYDMLTSVDEVNATTVRFNLAYPYPAFPNLLVLGILPARALGQPGPLTASPINTHPIGTGPYQLTEWQRGVRMVLSANPTYFDGPPAVRKVTVLFGGDDATRASRTLAGDIDGAPVAPAQTRDLPRSGGYLLATHNSAEYRTVSMPGRNPVTADPAVRLALNQAVNRRAMVDGTLAGKGEPASTPIPSTMPEFVEPGATFGYDRAQAGRTLDAAGWVPGPDGIRARGGTPARFTLLTPSGDAVALALAQQFAADARAVGVDVRVDQVDRDNLRARVNQDAALLTGGNAFDPDLQAYRLLHSSASPGVAATGEPVDPGSYADARVDAALDAGRREIDPAQRAADYRAFQRAYLANPGMVFLVFQQHTYALRNDWTGYQEVADAAEQGITWGPWWNLEKWEPKR